MVIGTKVNNATSFVTTIEKKKTSNINEKYNLRTELHLLIKKSAILSKIFTERNA